MINEITALCKGTKCDVKFDGKILGEFWTGKGLKQGCPLSEILYDISLRDRKGTLKKCGSWNKNWQQENSKYFVCRRHSNSGIECRTVGADDEDAKKLSERKMHRTECQKI